MKRFVDTNIVVYNYARVEPDKYRKASDAFLGVGRVCSTQVLSELSNVLSSGKFRFSWPEIDAIADEVVSAVDILIVSIATIKKARSLSLFLLRQPHPCLSHRSGVLYALL
jgi:predicted nucleic acid-binding protein